MSTDSTYSHFAWATQTRNQGGLGPNLKLPLIADRNMKISRDYGVLIEEEGVALRGLFIIDPKGTLRSVYLPLFPPSSPFCAPATICVASTQRPESGLSYIRTRETPLTASAVLPGSGAME